MALTFACSRPAEPAGSGGPAPAATPPSTTPTRTATAAASPTSQARELYRARCVACHGRDGLGDGPAAGVLNPRPRSFADGSWQSSVTDEAIEAIILQGGQAVGKSPLMPANLDLADKKDVVVALRVMVRKMGPRP